MLGGHGYQGLTSGSLSLGNLSILVKNISVIGILGLGMAIVLVGGGIDLAQVTGMLITSAFVLQHLHWGIPVAILLGLLIAIVIGLINGFLVAFVEIPAIFATLATSMVVMGVGRTWLVESRVALFPKEYESLQFIGQGRLWGIPMPIVIFAGFALITHIFLSKTMYGRFVYAQGDNLGTSRLTGIAVRPLTILQYILCSCIAYVAAMVQASTTGLVQVRSSDLVYNVILVVVLGGVSLIGGRGSVKSVIVGALLVGTLLNGMVLMNVQSDVQNIIRCVVLLIAILLDNRLHPRDEESARQGDI